MENEKNNEIIENHELMITKKFPYKYNNIHSYKERNNNIFNKIKRNFEQLSTKSKSMTATIKYEYTISKNQSKIENKIKNENKAYSQLNSTENILRTQSRILTNKPKNEFFLLKNEYSYRNKGFENFNLNNVCGSSHHKKKTKSIINKKYQQIYKNNLNNFDNAKENENFKVIKEYKLNYFCDTSDNIHNDAKVQSHYENLDTKNIDKNNKLQISKNDSFLNCEKNKNTEKEFNKKLTQENTYSTNEIKFLPESISEIKTENNFSDDKKINNNKYIIPKKENIQYNIKYKILNSTMNRNKKNIKNDFNKFLNGGSVHNSKKNKNFEEINKTMDKMVYNKKYDFWNKYFCQNNSLRGNITNKKNLNQICYNNTANNLKKIIFNSPQCANGKKINLINQYLNFKKEKCVMPPNNLSNIIFRKEKEFLGK